MSFPTTPMRVAVQNRHRKQAVYRIRIVMRAGDRTSRITLSSGPAFATDDNLPAFFQSVARREIQGNWIAAVLPFGSVLARALSNNPNPFARLGPFLQHGRRWISKSFPFVHALKQTFGGLPKRLKVRGA